MRKESPILFSPQMVKAILSGKKTQTRRVIKESFNGCLTMGGPHPCPNDPIVFHPGEVFPGENGEPDMIVDSPTVEAHFFCSTLDSVAKCAYGNVGDLIWVKESFFAYGWWVHNGKTKTGKQKWIFKDFTKEDAGGKYHYADDPPEEVISGRPHKKMGWYKRSSLFMPKAASRIWLQIENIGVERLKDISEKDAIAEGIKPNEVRQMWLFGATRVERERMYRSAAVDPFKKLWEQINGEGSWDVSPWVWVIKFRVLSIAGKPRDL